MSSLDKLISQNVDVSALLDELDLAEETLRTASFSQSKLFEQAARFYVQCMKERMTAEAAYEERKANRGHFYRKKQAAKSRKGDKVTEAQIKELVTLTKSVQQLRFKYEDTVQAETYAKLLLDAYKMRKDMIRAMSGVMDEEVRAEFRQLQARKSEEEFDKTRAALVKKYGREK